MTDETVADTVAKTALRPKGFDINWTRVEGIVGDGALLTSFIWFLGMPTGMAFGVGFGIVLLLDFIRTLIFGGSRYGHPEPDTPDIARH